MTSRKKTNPKMTLMSQREGTDVAKYKTQTTLKQKSTRGVLDSILMHLSGEWMDPSFDSKNLFKSGKNPQPDISVSDLRGLFSRYISTEQTNTYLQGRLNQVSSQDKKADILANDFARYLADIYGNKFILNQFGGGSFDTYGPFYVKELLFPLMMNSGGETKPHSRMDYLMKNHLPGVDVAAMRGDGSEKTVAGNIAAKFGDPGYPLRDMKNMRSGPFDPAEKGILSVMYNGSDTGNSKRSYAQRDLSMTFDSAGKGIFKKRRVGGPAESSYQSEASSKYQQDQEDIMNRTLGDQEEEKKEMRQAESETRESQFQTFGAKWWLPTKGGQAPGHFENLALVNKGIATAGMGSNLGGQIGQNVKGGSVVRGGQQFGFMDQEGEDPSFDMAQSQRSKKGSAPLSVASFYSFVGEDGTQLFNRDGDINQEWVDETMREIVDDEYARNIHRIQGKMAYIVQKQKQEGVPLKQNANLVKMYDEIIGSTTKALESNINRKITRHVWQMTAKLPSDMRDELMTLYREYVDFSGSLAAQRVGEKMVKWKSKLFQEDYYGEDKLKALIEVGEAEYNRQKADQLARSTVKRQITETNGSMLPDFSGEISLTQALQMGPVTGNLEAQQQVYAHTMSRTSAAGMMLTNKVDNPLTSDNLGDSAHQSATAEARRQQAIIDQALYAQAQSSDSINGLYDPHLQLLQEANDVGGGFPTGPGQGGHGGGALPDNYGGNADRPYSQFIPPKAMSKRLLDKLNPNGQAPGSASFMAQQRSGRPTTIGGAGIGGGSSILGATQAAQIGVQVLEPILSGTGIAHTPQNRFLSNVVGYNFVNKGGSLMYVPSPGGKDLYRSPLQFNQSYMHQLRAIGPETTGNELMTQQTAAYRSSDAIYRHDLPIYNQQAIADSVIAKSMASQDVIKRAAQAGYEKSATNMYMSAGGVNENEQKVGENIGEMVSRHYTPLVERGLQQPTSIYYDVSGSFFTNRANIFRQRRREKDMYNY